MGKKNNFGNSWLITVAIVSAPFVLLWEKVGPFWFIVILAVSVVLLVKLMSYTEKRKTVAANNEDVAGESHSAWHNHCDRIEQAWARGDFDWAREQLQRIAYSMVGKRVTEEQKHQFTRLMKDFASQDPMYREVMTIALPYITANPGTMQSKIYTQLPDWSREEVRYVLYFANELGHIHRVKKGNSYKLMPPGATVEGEVIDKSNQ